MMLMDGKSGKSIRLTMENRNNIHMVNMGSMPMSINGKMMGVLELAGN